MELSWPILNRKTITKKIYQIYHDKSLIKDSVKENILKLNPDYAYELFDFDDGKQFVQNYFMGENILPQILDYLENLENIAHKSDLLRYCILYKLGGVYIDVDLFFKISFDEIIKISNNSEFISSFGLTGACTRMKENEYLENNKIYHPIMSNGLLLTKAGNKIIFQLINDIIKGQYKKRHAANVYYFHNYLKYFNKNNNLEKFKNYNLDNINTYLFKEITYEKGKNCYVNKIMK